MPPTGAGTGVLGYEAAEGGGEAPTTSMARAQVPGFATPSGRVK